MSDTSPDPEQPAMRPSRILCLDGGGVKGIGTLEILKTVMEKVNESREGQPEIKPCECFDLICGTSTGGLIALMLGRLEFTVDQAIDMYGKLAQAIFTKPKSWFFGWETRFAAGAQYDHRPLEEKLKEAVSESPLGVDGNAPLIDNERQCKCFVVTTNLKQYSPKAILLRCYGTEPGDGKSNMKIWEAGRATSAAPTYFLPHRMAHGVEYTDGGTIANNPTELGYHEAGRLWPGRPIGLILSIGTGREKELTVDNATAEFIPSYAKWALRLFSKDMLSKLEIATFAAMAMTHTGRPHERVLDNILTFQRLHGATTSGTEQNPKIYFRLNLDREDAIVPLDAWQEMCRLQTLARTHMAGSEPQRERDAIAAMLLESEPKSQDGLVVPPQLPAGTDTIGEKQLLAEAFFASVRQGDVEGVRKLLNIDADSSWRDPHGRSPLLVAAERGHTMVAKMLIQEGSDLEAYDQLGSTALYLAADNGHIDVVRLLLDAGARVDTRTARGTTPFMVAAKFGYEDIAKLLVEAGAHIETKDNDCLTALSFAAAYGHESIARFLVANGADIEAQARDGGVPLTEAVTNGQESIARLLIAEGADIEAKTDDGRTPLLLAVRFGRESITRLLVAEGADIEARGNDGNTPLSQAVSMGYESIVRFLVVEGADIEVTDVWGRRPVSIAINRGGISMAAFLVASGANISKKDEFYGKTPLEMAKQKGLNIL